MPLKQINGYILLLCVFFLNSFSFSIMGLCKYYYIFHRELFASIVTYGLRAYLLNHASCYMHLYRKII